MSSSPYALSLTCIFFTFVLSVTPVSATGTGPQTPQVTKYQDIKTLGTPALLKDWVEKITSPLSEILPARYRYRVALILLERSFVHAESTGDVLTGRVFITGQGISYTADQFVDAVKNFARRRSFKNVSAEALIRNLLRLPDPITGCRQTLEPSDIEADGGDYHELYDLYGQRGT